MYPRRLDAAWEALAPAKLNLYLEVLGKRTDGFHELETLMAPIRLYDRLQWRPSGDPATSMSLRIDPATPAALQAGVPVDRRNLVRQAAELLARDAGVPATGEFILTKRIPSQAGLGGGSSDAAAALVLANAAWGLNYSRSELSRLAAQLGSDVPFFLAGQTAICRGRGERVEPVASFPRLDVVVVVPPEGVSTAAAFQTLAARGGATAKASDSRHALNRLLESLLAGRLTAAGHWMINRLQAAATELCPWIGQLGTAFASTSCHGHMLTGSGSAYFAVMRSARHARRVAAELASRQLGTVFASATCR
jgi:4-diphosphocytidyl-2-C-methyl-D-erythritol kinase